MNACIRKLTAIALLVFASVNPAWAFSSLTISGTFLRAVTDTAIDLRYLALQHR
ncbi:MAG: hypothetical protein KGZ80_13035 [Methylomonas sp.]|nr:hypothetical protein [Methylomonas sp.]